MLKKYIYIYNQDEIDNKKQNIILIKYNIYK